MEADPGPHAARSAARDFSLVALEVPPVPTTHVEVRSLSSSIRVTPCIQFRTSAASWRWPSSRRRSADLVLTSPASPKRRAHGAASVRIIMIADANVIRSLNPRLRDLLLRQPHDRPGRGATRPTDPVGDGPVVAREIRPPQRQACRLLQSQCALPPSALGQPARGWTDYQSTTRPPRDHLCRLCWITILLPTSSATRQPS